MALVLNRKLKLPSISYFDYVRKLEIELIGVLDGETFDEIVFGGSISILRLDVGFYSANPVFEVGILFLTRSPDCFQLLHFLGNIVVEDGELGGCCLQCRNFYCAV